MIWWKQRGMGIYTNRGVEYHVLTEDRTHVVVPISRSDGRLVASRYYAARSASWFGPDASTSRCTPIDADDFDVALTSQEEDALAKLLLELGDGVVYHGWYDVVTVGSSYQ